MKPLSNLRITKFVAAAALAGLSIVAAYAAAPSYTPDTNSPIDSTNISLAHSGTGGSASDALDHFNSYLSAIEAQLDLLPDTATGAGATRFTHDTLIAPFPATDDPNSSLAYTAATAANFTKAVANAVVADPAHAFEIVAAAIQLKPTLNSAILTDIAKSTAPAAIVDAVRAMAFINPANAGTAGASAITSIIAANNPTDLGPNNGNMALAAAEAMNGVDDNSRQLVEAIARTAIASTKNAKPKLTNPGVAQDAAAKAVATSLMNAFLADAATPGSNAALYLDDIGRGAANGVATFDASAATGVSRGEIGTTMMNVFSSYPSLNNAKNVVHFAMGVLDACSITTANDSTFSFVAPQMQAALGGVYSAEIGVGYRFMNAIRTTNPVPNAANAIVNFDNTLLASDFTNGHMYFALLGTMQGISASGADYIKKAFSKGEDLGVLDNNDKKDILAATVAVNPAAAATYVTTAINARALDNTTDIGISYLDAVNQAIPAATRLQSGAIAAAAAKKKNASNVSVSIPTADAIILLNASIAAANTAGYQSAIPDIALAVLETRPATTKFTTGPNAGQVNVRSDDNQLIAAAITAAPSGWEEAIAAYTIYNKSSASAALDFTTNLGAAQVAANTKGGSGLSNAVTLAMELVQRAKASPATQFDDAVAALHGTLAGKETDSTKAGNEIPATTVSGASNPRAVIAAFGAATSTTAVSNSTLAIPVLSAALALKSTNNTDRTQLLDYAISLNKAKENSIRLAYKVAVDVVDHPENLFDVVDHTILTNTAEAANIVTAAVAARPEYAHYAARAALFRAPATARVAVAKASIQFANMRTTQVDDPAAVAAISAAAVLGVNDSLRVNPSTLTTAALVNTAYTKRKTALTSVITGLVQGTLTYENINKQVITISPAATKYVDDGNGLQGETATFPEATGLGTTVTDVTLKREKGTAAILTGVIAQLQGVGKTTLIQGNEPTPAPVDPDTATLTYVAIKAATAAMKNHALAFAQAAGAACEALAKAGTATFASGGFDGIAKAIMSGLGLSSGAAALTTAQKAWFGLAAANPLSGAQALQMAKNAALVGSAQYLAKFANSNDPNGTYGAGAAGILNYAHNSGAGTPVTSIVNF